MYQIPTTSFEGTHYAPVTTPLRDAAKLTGKPVEPANWVEDLQQVTSGAGSIAFSRKLADAEQHACPVCGSTTSRKLVHEPNCAYYGRQHSCECGADYDAEDIGINEDDDSWSQQALARLVAKVSDQTKTDFAYWWQRSAPAGTKAIYDDHFTSLLGVELADGRRVMRG